MGKILATAFVMLCCSVAMGTGFTLKAGYPSGGVAVGFFTMAYTMLTGGYYGGGIPGTGCTATGTITYKWEWTGTGQAPKNVVLTVNSIATWSGGGGACGNGLGAPEILNRPTPTAPPIGGNSTSTEYFVVDVINDEVTYQITPFSGANGSCLVKVAASVTDVVISVTGGVYPSGYPHFLIGQNQLATVSAGSFDLDTDRSWGVSGVPIFKQAVWGEEGENSDDTLPYRSYRDSHSYDVDFDFNVEEFSFYAYEPGEEEVTCTVTVLRPGTSTPIDDAEAALDVEVETPDFSLDVIVDGVSILDANVLPTLLTLDIETLFDFSAETSMLFTSHFGDSGKVALCQLIDRAIMFYGEPSPEFPAGADYGERLDNTFPYRLEKTADGSPYTEDDIPSITIRSATAGNRMTGVGLVDSFKMSVIYLPPGASEWVPLNTKDWSWVTAATETGTPGTWNNPIGDPSREFLDADYTLEYVTWEDVYFNNLLENF